MALSQLLEDSPLRPGRNKQADDLYNETHRLALEELLSGGLDNFLDFLRKEKIPNFLSDDEVQRIRSAAVAPRHEDAALERSVSSSSLDCSSVTYFPEVSDVEPPLLELGWPAFTAGSYRGVTRAVAHFQPSYGDCIYSCKEAARRMIRSAREVIAIVTDSLTDLDVFKDLEEACLQRGVPVYVLLDQACAPAFLKACRSAGVRLEELRQMRVRIITGSTYYMRSGARITGEVHERFMLIDGNRVATGSYRFNWTDGKLNSSNLIELSGQITEKFDEEFRVLFAQSLPLRTQAPPPSCEPPLLRHGSAPLGEPLCLTSTPTHKTTAAQPPAEPLVDLEWAEPEEILAGSSAPLFPADQLSAEPTPPSCHASTQTRPSVTDSDAQTDLGLLEQPDLLAAAAAAGGGRPSRASFLFLREVTFSQEEEDRCHKLSRERREHYTNIRSKLQHMMTSLSQRRELADITNMAAGRHRDRGPEPNASPGGATWPRARCVR